MAGTYPSLFTYLGPFLWLGEWADTAFTEPFDIPDPEGA